MVHAVLKRKMPGAGCEGGTTRCWTGRAKFVKQLLPQANLEGSPSEGSAHAGPTGVSG